MEKIELQKSLEKKKAYLICVIVFLGLIMPSLISLCRDCNLSFQFQTTLCAINLMIMGLVYKKMKTIRIKIKKNAQ